MKIECCEQKTGRDTSQWERKKKHEQTWDKPIWFCLFKSHNITRNPVNQNVMRGIFDNVFFCLTLYIDRIDEYFFLATRILARKKLPSMSKMDFMSPTMTNQKQKKRASAN